MLTLIHHVSHRLGKLDRKGKVCILFPSERARWRAQHIMGHNLWKDQRAAITIDAYISLPSSNDKFLKLLFLLYTLKDLWLLRRSMLTSATLDSPPQVFALHDMMADGLAGAGIACCMAIDKVELHDHVSSVTEKREMRDVV